MKIVTIICVIVVVVDVLMVLYIRAFNKMRKLKNDLLKEYQSLYEELQYRFKLAEEYLPLVRSYIDAGSLEELNKLISDFKGKVDVNDVANDYYSLNNSMVKVFSIASSNNLSFPDWDKAFNDSLMRIQNSITEYDDEVLKINNLVDMFPSSVVASITGFSKWVYFRTK